MNQVTFMHGEMLVRSAVRTKHWGQRSIDVRINLCCHVGVYSSIFLPVLF